MDFRTRALIRKKLKREEPDPSETAGELNIVPLLDIVVNIMLFLLATTAATMAVAEHQTESPSTCSNCPGGERSMQLSVTVADGGIIVASREGRLAPGCEEVGGATSPTVPRAGRGYDFEALASCLTRIHERFPQEREVVLTADPGVQYEWLIGAMDAIAPNFEDIRLSAGVR